MSLDEVHEPALAGATGGDLRLEVAEHLGRLPRVLLDDAEKLLVLDPAVVQLEERQAEALLEDLRRMDGDAPRGDSADVGVVGQRGGVPLQLVLDEDRLDHVDVGQVLPAGAVRVVGNEDVAGTRGVGVLGAEVPHHRREAAELHREGEALRDEAAVAVAEGGGVVHRVANDRRVRASHQDERHLVGRRRERVPDDLERDRVEAAPHASSNGHLHVAEAVEPGGAPGRDDDRGVVLVDEERPRALAVEQRGPRHDRRRHRPLP